MNVEKSSNRLDTIDDTQTKSILPYSEIELALKNIKKTEPNSTNHLIVLLYNYNAWRDDVGNLKIYNESGNPPKDKQNYYSVKQNKIFLRSYKTVREYGAKEYDLPKEVAKIFDIQNKAEKGKKKYLISKPDGEKYSEGTLGRELMVLPAGGTHPSSSRSAFSSAGNDHSRRTALARQAVVARSHPHDDRQAHQAAQSPL